jgi:hypothetical protein
VQEPYPDPEPLPGSRGRRAPSRGRKWLFRAGVVGLLLVGLVAGRETYLRCLADRHLQEVIAEIDRLEAPNGWRLHELEAARDPVPDEENAALVVVAALRLRPNLGPLEQLEKTLEPGEPTEQIDANRLARLRSQLQTLGPAVEEARKVADLPRGRYPVDSSRDHLPVGAAYAKQIGELARMVTWDAWLRAQDNDIDGALTSCRAVVNLGRSVGDEPRVLSQLNRAWCLERALLAVERALAQGQGDDAGLAALQQLLQDEDRQPLLLMTMRGQRAIQHAMLERVESGEIPLSRPAGDGGPLESVWERVDTVLAGDQLQTGHARYLEYMTRYVETANLPAHEQDEPMRQLDEAIHSGPRTLATFSIPRMLPDLARDMRHHQARVRCLQVALAAERYRLAHGRWPEEPAALVPGFLASVPSDPCDGNPLRFRRVADGVVVYSVGPDRQDNGGLFDRQRPRREGADIGLRLWDVARRRQPPRGEPPP